MRGKGSVSLNRIIDAFSWRNFSSDLKIIYFWLGLAIFGIFLPVLNTSPFRIIYALPLIIFIPGYTLTAALFPNNIDIDGIERFALSIGLSIILIPCIGLVLNFTVWAIRLIPIIISLIIFTIVMVQIAQYRRFLEPEESRFHVDFSEFIIVKKEGSTSFQGTVLTRALNTIIFLVLIGAICVTVYVIAIPKTEEEFTDFYILGENGKAADYPTDLISGSPSQVIIGIHNHEYKTVTYIVEIWMTNLSFDASTNSTIVNRMERLDQFSVSIQHNETYQTPHTFTPGEAGLNQLTFLLFKDAEPTDMLTGNERINGSYRNLHLQVTVQSPIK